MAIQTGLGTAVELRHIGTIDGDQFLYARRPSVERFGPLLGEIVNLIDAFDARQRPARVIENFFRVP
jgi:hypothetical protein